MDILKAGCDNLLKLSDDCTYSTTKNKARKLGDLLQNGRVLFAFHSNHQFFLLISSTAWSL